jgi:hypothetical protein
MVAGVSEAIYPIIIHPSTAGEQKANPVICFFHADPRIQR